MRYFSSLFLFRTLSLRHISSLKTTFTLFKRRWILCFPSPWLIHRLALLSLLSPTPHFLSNGRKNQENVDKRESICLCSFQCDKSPMTGQLNDCWKCSGDTARVAWYYCVCSALPQSDLYDGEGSKGNEPSSRGRQQGLELWDSPTATRTFAVTLVGGLVPFWDPPAHRHQDTGPCEDWVHWSPLCPSVAAMWSEVTLKRNL